MKTKTKLSIIAIMAITFSISSCKKDKKELPPVDEGELITTIKLQFTNASNATDVKSFTWKDIDGDGGNPAVIDDINLKPNTNYKMDVVAVLNETAKPADQDITEEIKEESFEHLLVYKPSANLLTVLITDKDKNNLPIGLEANVTTKAVAKGTLNVILRHQPGVKNGTEAPGSSDFDITYNVKIQ